MTTPWRLYRDPRRGRIAGVCAGIAEYFGLDVTLVRLGWGIALLFFAPPVLIGYLVLALALPRRPEGLYASPAEEERRRHVALEPRRSLRDVRLSFDELAARLARIEAAVLRDEFELRRKFREMR